MAGRLKAGEVVTLANTALEAAAKVLIISNKLNGHPYFVRYEWITLMHLLDFPERAG